MADLSETKRVFTVKERKYKNRTFLQWWDLLLYVHKIIIRHKTAYFSQQTCTISKRKLSSTQSSKKWMAADTEAFPGILPELCYQLWHFPCLACMCRTVSPYTSDKKKCITCHQQKTGWYIHINLGTRRRRNNNLLWALAEWTTTGCWWNAANAAQ